MTHFDSSRSYLGVAAALPASEARVRPVVGLAHVAVLPGHAPVMGGKISMQSSNTVSVINIFNRVDWQARQKACQLSII